MNCHLTELSKSVSKGHCRKTPNGLGAVVLRNKGKRPSLLGAWNSRK